MRVEGYVPLFTMCIFAFSTYMPGGAGISDCTMELDKYSAVLCSGHTGSTDSCPKMSPFAIELCSIDTCSLACSSWLFSLLVDSMMFEVGVLGRVWGFGCACNARLQVEAWSLSGEELGR